MLMKARTCKRASLTIEAALILPMFMTGLLTLVSVLFMWLVSQRIQASLLLTSEELAMKLADGSTIPLSEVEKEIAGSIPAEDLKYIENGTDGIDMSGSNIDDGEYIELVLNCNLVPLTNRFGLIHVPCRRRCFAHKWVGYDKPYFPNEQYVYVTEDSEVYHLDRECSHINLSVRATTAGEVTSHRNSSGGRYRPCEICHSSLADGTLYIADDGDRYHNSISCRGLKRTVRAIRISEIGDRRPCSRCGR